MARDTPPLDGLDLNLLVTLRALLREGSVTRAAERLGQRQPTLSRALATLRAAFGDELLVRSGRSMALTPLARSLRNPLERTLAALDRLRAVGSFDPATAERTFRMVVPDIAGLLLVPDLTVRLMAEAPGIDVQVLSAESDALNALLDDDIDLAIGALYLDHPELYTRVLGARMPWSVVCGPSHASWGQPCDLETWLASEHVQVTPQGRPDVSSGLDATLDELGLTRRVRVYTTHVAAVAPTLLESPLVTSLPTPMALRVAPSGTLWVTPHPLSHALEQLTVRLTWHRLHHADEGHAWLRNLVVEVFGARM